MSGFYNIGKESLLARVVPAEAGLYAIGVNEDYEYDPTHEDFAVFTPHILLPEKEIQGVSFTGGTLRADNPQWLAAGAGVADRSLVLAGLALYFMLADEGTLFAFIDSATAGLPQALTGVNVTTRWDSRGILKL